MLGAGRIYKLPQNASSQPLHWAVLSDFVKCCVQPPNAFLPSPSCECMLKERAIASSRKAIVAVGPHVFGHTDRASCLHAQGMAGGMV